MNLPAWSDQFSLFYPDSEMHCDNCIGSAASIRSRNSSVKPCCVTENETFHAKHRSYAVCETKMN